MRVCSHDCPNKIWPEFEFSGLCGMEYTLGEEFKRSWLTSCIGLVLSIVGIWLLTWNEGRAVHHAHSLDEAYQNVIPLNVYEPIRSEYEGRLIHISGNLLIDEPLTEPEYGIAIQAVKLKRRVQMYQWVEERSLTNYGDTEANQKETNDYYYVTEWRDKLVNSNSFYIRHGHHNPTEMPLKSHIYLSPSVRVGQLSLGSEIKEKFSDYTEMTSDDRPERRDIKMHLGIYYHCDDVWNPEVGDIRVQFYYAGHNGETVTIIAKQKDGALIPYTTSKNHEVALLRYGSLNIKQMFDAEHSDAKLETWKWRAAGLFVLYAASVCLARLLRIIYINVPGLHKAFGDEISASTSFCIALSTTLFVVAIAWSAYRPWVAFGLLTASFSPFLYCVMSATNDTQYTNIYNR